MTSQCGRGFSQMRATDWLLNEMRATDWLLNQMRATDWLLSQIKPNLSNRVLTSRVPMQAFYEY